jgi:hypothetical protein
VELLNELDDVLDEELEELVELCALVSGSDEVAEPPRIGAP